MDRGLSTGTRQEDGGLRERTMASQSSSAPGLEALTATGEGEVKDKAGKGKKAYGRTPDGKGT
jgi:phosphatidylethanolamine N-methyltransferase